MLTKEIGTLERTSPYCAKAAESVACATYVTQRIFVISSLSPNIPCRGDGDGRCSGFRGGRHQYHGSPAVRWKVTKLSCSTVLTDIKSGYEMIAHVGNCILPSLFSGFKHICMYLDLGIAHSSVVSSQFASCIAQVRKFAFCHCIARSKPGSLFCMQASTKCPIRVQ